MPQLRRIGLAIDAVAEYGRSVIRGIMSFAHSHPHWIITVEPLWAFGSLPSIEQWPVDGMIVQVFNLEFEKRVIELGLPAVNVSNFLAVPPRIPTVVPDDDAIARMAVQYLVSLGFHRLGFLWPDGPLYGQIRRAAFGDEARRLGVEFHECDAMNHDIGRWLERLPKPIAILGCNDDWAHRLLNLTRRANIRVPDEIAVLGVDNDELFNTLVTPALSSIEIPGEQIGYVASQQLDQLMNGEALADELTTLSPLRVVPRASTDVLTIDDEYVALAIRFIRAHVDRPLSVTDVLDHVPLSRRSLERRFRRAIGQSISEVIRDAHLKQAKQLLLSTDMSLSQVASATGLVSATRLGIVFRRATGETPIQFRNRARRGGRFDPDHHLDPV